MPVIPAAGASFLEPPPVVGGHVAELVVAEVALDVEDGAELAGVDHPLDLLPALLEAALVAYSEDDAGLAAGGEHPAHAGGFQGERLLAEDLLACGGGGDHLLLVQPVRRGEDHRVDLRVGQRLLVLCEGGEAEGGGVLLGAGGYGIDSADDLDDIAVLEALSDLLSPPAEAYLGGLQHRIVLSPGSPGGRQPRGGRRGTYDNAPAAGGGVAGGGTGLQGGTHLSVRRRAHINREDLFMTPRPTARRSSTMPGLLMRALKFRRPSPGLGSAGIVGDGAGEGSG